MSDEVRWVYAIFLDYWASTENAFFLFITFERCNVQIIICNTAFSAYHLSITSAFHMASSPVLCRFCSSYAAASA